MAKRFTDTEKWRNENRYADIGDKEVRKIIFLKFNGKCAYCGEEIYLGSFNIDHIVPLRRGMVTTDRGQSVISNYNPSCRTCNTSKSSMDLEVWRKELELKTSRLQSHYSIYRIVKKFGLIQETGSRVIFYFEKHG